MNLKYTALAITSLIPLLALCAHAQTADQMMEGMKIMQNPKKQMEIMQQAMQKAALITSGIKTEGSDLEGFVKKIKTLKIGQDTADDVSRKLGKPMSKINFMGTQTWTYMFMSGGMTDNVSGVIQIGQSGNVSCVKVSKMNGMNMEDIYIKGTLEMPGMAVEPSQSPSAKDQSNQSDHFPLKECAPENATEGQIYFNKTDKHFYGWDGSSWLKLDTKP
jgi:hypothetical protein